MKKINFPTLVSIIIALIMIAFMGMIIVMQFAPTTGIADIIRSVIPTAGT